MRVRVTHDIDDLANDLDSIATRAPSVMSGALHDEARLGNELARGFAQRSAGSHGKHYPRAFSVERRSALSYEYGPDASKPQGGMSFERGSRNQPPHNDLAKSADVIATRLGPAVLNEVAGMFWPS